MLVLACTSGPEITCCLLLGSHRTAPITSSQALGSIARVILPVVPGRCTGRLASGLPRTLHSGVIAKAAGAGQKKGKRAGKDEGGDEGTVRAAGAYVCVCSVSCVSWRCRVCAGPVAENSLEGHMLLRGLYSSPEYLFVATMHMTLSSLTMLHGRLSCLLCCQGPSVRLPPFSLPHVSAAASGPYSTTVRLPTTPFSLRANSPVREPQIQAHWEETRTYQQLVENNPGVGPACSGLREERRHWGYTGVPSIYLC